MNNQTMVFWHGGDLSDIDNTFRQQTKKQEYGPGLYLTTSYNVVKDYVKGNRKLYRVEVSLGNSLEDAEIPYEKVIEFLNKLPKSISIKLKNIIDKYDKDGFVNAEIINNLFVNYNLLKPEISYKLKQFYLENNIDYSLVNNAFGWGEDMMILFNTNKIINVERIGPKDKIDKFELHKEGMELQDEEVTAYHGSPYSFKKFSTQKMGTGEGVQAFGWGLYFTDLEDIARQYTKAGEGAIFIDKTPLSKRARFQKLPQDEKIEVEQLLRDIANGELTRDELFGMAAYRKGDFLTAYNFIRDAKEVKFSPEATLYKVSLHKGKTPEQYTWLEWDRQVSDNIFDKIGNQAKLNGNAMLEMIAKDFNRRNQTGENVYKNISKILNSDKEASLLLLRAGIDGIKYPAESIARGATSDTARGFNYVVFDENAVSIEKQTQLEEMEVSKKDLIQNWLNNPKKLKEDAEDANFVDEITKGELEEEKKKADRCLRIARRKMPQTSAYRSGLIVQCRRGKIWKGLNEDEGENSDDKYFNGMLITNDSFRGDKPIWQPLYEFLKSIFGEKYKQAADGYMFYASYIIEDFNNLEVFQYRHGITRKYFYLDSEGQPYKIDFSYSNLKKDNYVSGVQKIPYQEQFKFIYSDLIKYIESACKTNDCVVPDDSYLMKYSDYKILRDKALNKFGYNVQTIKSKKDIEDFGKELNEDEYLLDNYPKELIKKAHDAITRRKGKDYAPDVHELQAWIDKNQESLDEKWSEKYKRSIDCNNPKGFSQKAHCKGRLKEGEFSKFVGSEFGDEQGNIFSVEEVYKFVEANKQKYFKPNFPISKLEHNLEWWDINYDLNNKEHKRRMMNSDTSYPLLVVNEGNNLSVADGLNRLYKAVNIENKKNIDIFLVNKEDIMFLNKKSLNEDEYLLEPKRPKPKTTLDLGISTEEGKGVDNIIAVYNEADDEEKDYWGKWYHHANKDVNTLSNKFNIDFRIAAAVVAVLSPGNKWLGNLYAAEKVIQKFNDPLIDIKINAYGRNIDKALKILETGDISYVKGPKVTVFFNSLMDPQSVDKELVLDSHAINIWFGIKRNLKETPNISNKLRKRVLDDYRKASEILGVSLQSLQAVTWYVWKYTKKPPKQLPHTNIKVKKSNKKTTELPLDEKWSEKYKRSIDCNNPKGFSQKAHCKGRLKEEEQSMGKRKIYVLVGPPSVGKSTWIKNTFGDIQPYVISRDDIVEQVADNLGWTYDDLFVAPPQGSQLGDYDEKYGEVIQSPSYMSWQPLSFSKVLEANNQVHVTFTKRVSNAVSSGKDIVVDMTNMTAGARKNALKAIEGNENLFEKIAVVFPFQGAEDVIIDVARKRAEAAKRMGKSKTLPDSVMRKMFASFQDVSPEEGFDKVVQQDNRELLSTLNEKTDFSKEKSKGLHGWFERQGGKGKSKGWVDCNTCRTVDGKKKCKTCGRQEGEKRAKYPACRPTPSACGTKGKGKSWGKKSANEDVLNEQSKQDIEREMKLNEIKSLFQRHIGKL